MAAAPALAAATTMDLEMVKILQKNKHIEGGPMPLYLIDHFEGYGRGSGDGYGDAYGNGYGKGSVYGGYSTGAYYNEGYGYGLGSGSTSKECGSGCGHGYGFGFGYGSGSICCEGDGEG